MKKITLKTITTLALIVLVSFFIVEVLMIVEGSRKTVDKVDYVIVLGARLYGEKPSPALLERLKFAKEYLSENKDVKVIVSGGQGMDEDISEAQAMKKYLVDNGIDKDSVIIEDKSTSTFENLQFSLEKIKQLDDKENVKVLLATNKYHIFRAKFLAKRLGMIPYGLPAKTPISIIVPQYIREYFAVIKSIFFDK
ncbi:YdcF family protein [Sporanaerobacter acetigenes]|uniref:YdcF family protein n=1 Tax=Sporanaerobacter acetigenes TaxID=165813 RepID=UPI003329FCF8